MPTLGSKTRGSHLKVATTNPPICKGLPLPRELRNMIYELTVELKDTCIYPAIRHPPKNPPKFYTGKRKSSRRGNKIARRRACGRKMYPTQLAVLALTCKQFREDLQAPLFIYYKRTFCFQNPHAPLKYFESIGQTRVNLISSLDFVLTYYWFTVSTKPCGKLFRVLGACEGLKKLELEVLLDFYDTDNDPYMVGGTRHISWTQFSSDLLSGLKNLRHLESFGLIFTENNFCCPYCLHCLQKYWGPGMEGEESFILIEQIWQQVITRNLNFRAEKEGGKT